MSPPHHDPAPSRLSYRMQRWWLTPTYRRGLRIGLPILLIAGVVFWYVSDEARVASIVNTIEQARDAIEDRPEFMVRVISVDGASAELAQAVRDELALRLPISSFDMDLDAMRQKIKAFNAVADATLRIKTDGVLAVEITERKPAILWRNGGELNLLDADGHMVAGASLRADWPELPLVAGAGADREVAQALALIAAAEPIKERLRGLVRMGERRWDVVLDRDQRLLLPEDEPVAALERLIALDKGREMLKRDLTIIDFRNPHRPTVRLNTYALNDLKGVDDSETGETTQ